MMIKRMIGLGKESIFWFFASLLLISPEIVVGDDVVGTYKSEKMWPALRQEWYFNSIGDMAVDAAGNLYVADTNNHRILMFTAHGQLITKWGNKGDAAGEFETPRGIAIGDNGNVYVVDSGNSRIQIFSPAGEPVAQWGSHGEGDGDFFNPVGIAMDPLGNIYVVDSYNHRIQVFDSDQNFIAKWGVRGNGDGQFDQPGYIALDGEGNLFVTDGDNHRVQKFSPLGVFLASWGGEGNGDGKFSSPSGIKIDQSGGVYVADLYNDRIQIFDSAGAFISKWGEYGNDDGKISGANALAIDKNGNVRVADAYINRIQTFTPGGEFLVSWASNGDGDGEFDTPSGVAINAGGNVYIADLGNSRIQVFTSTGHFESRWGAWGDDEGNFTGPSGIAVDSAGNTFVVEEWSDRVQKFAPDGSFSAAWGAEGSGDGQFDNPTDIAIDKDDDVYVVDSRNCRVQKFTSGGAFIGKWGKNGAGDGEFANSNDGPAGVATDDLGFVYVVDKNNHRIQKFDSDGNFVKKWGEYGDGDGEFKWPRGIELDGAGHVYVADTENNRIQVFTSDGLYITQFGEQGSNPGQFSEPTDIAMGLEGEIYVVDTGNNRVQVFTRGDAPGGVPIGASKAIIVAGGGPYGGNTLWDATRMCSNYAYRVLTYQGYTKDDIYYLTSDANLDLDGNGVLDDVDADAVNANLQYAITNWAEDARDLLVYITDHGGDGNFRMSENELLEASALDSWLDRIETKIPGNVTFIYDACQSESFFSRLTPAPGKTRILIASASWDESAYFTSGGTLSFSYLFWGNIFNGMNLWDAFLYARNSIQYTYTNQTPMLDDNGNGVGNESEDGEIAGATRVGIGLVSAGDIPVVGAVSPDRTIDNGDAFASIRADNVTDANGISRVWAVITPPNYQTGDPRDPVLSMPILEMTLKEGARYEGVYTGFNVNGVYNIGVYASDRYGAVSLPVQTTVTQTQGVTSHAALGSDLSITIPCLDVLGPCYRIELNYYLHPSDSINHYWMLDAESAAPAMCCDSSDASLENEFHISTSKLEFQDLFYPVKLEYFQNAVDPSGFYWVLDGHE